MPTTASGSPVAQRRSTLPRMLRSLLLTAAALTLWTAPAHADEATSRYLLVSVQGMDCAGCNKTVSAAFESVPFLEGMNTSFAVTGSCGKLIGELDEAALTASLEGTGYSVAKTEVVTSCPDGLKGTQPGPWDGKTEGLDVSTISHGEVVEIAPHLAAGKYTIIDYGASWCAPCHEAADTLVTYMGEHADVAVRAIELAGETAQASYEQPVVAQHLAYVSGIPWLVVYEPGGKVISKTQSVDKTLAAIDKHRNKMAKRK